MIGRQAGLGLAWCAGAGALKRAAAVAPLCISAGIGFDAMAAAAAPAHELTRADADALASYVGSHRPTTERVGPSFVSILSKTLCNASLLTGFTR